jgi:hypothetical protein
MLWFLDKDSSQYFLKRRDSGLHSSADFNGDGHPDLVVANEVHPGTVTVLLNAADWP